MSEWACGQQPDPSFVTNTCANPGKTALHAKHRVLPPARVGFNCDQKVTMNSTKCQLVSTIFPNMKFFLTFRGNFAQDMPRRNINALEKRLWSLTPIIESQSR